MFADHYSIRSPHKTWEVQKLRAGAQIPPDAATHWRPRLLLFGSFSSSLFFFLVTATSLPYTCHTQHVPFQ